VRFGHELRHDASFHTSQVEMATQVSLAADDDEDGGGGGYFSAADARAAAKAARAAADRDAAKRAGELEVMCDVLGM